MSRSHIGTRRPIRQPSRRFPYNYYDILEPDIDFDHRALGVSGAVTRPGDYALDGIPALPKIVQNTRHVCVEAPAAEPRPRRAASAPDADQDRIH